jgi:LAO/AO transport system kinase
MRDLAGDPGIFIRSMASRGALGGLARTTHSVSQLLDAAGYDWILIETVGAGQAEVDIASSANTTIVIDAPGMGDDIQANKAGILEIADILVVNKADLPGAENTRRILEMTIHMATPALGASSAEGANSHWITPVIGTIATRGEGIAELKTAIIDHKSYLDQSGQGNVRERARVEHHIKGLLREKLLNRFMSKRVPGYYDERVEAVLNRQQSPYEAVDQLMKDF